MSAYVLFEVSWHDQEARAEYLRLFLPALAAHGGKVVATDNSPGALEGSLLQPGSTLVLLTFPDRAAAERWHDSEEYRPALQIRERGGSTRAILFG
jgi:uncharacterized protein (DUF1330 family)